MAVKTKKKTPDTVVELSADTLLQPLQDYLQGLHDQAIRDACDSSVGCVARQSRLRVTSNQVDEQADSHLDALTASTSTWGEKLTSDEALDRVAACRETSRRSQKKCFRTTLRKSTRSGIPRLAQSR
jgi:hypothetical protein